MSVDRTFVERRRKQLAEAGEGIAVSDEMWERALQEQRRMAAEEEKTLAMQTYENHEVEELMQRLLNDNDHVAKIWDEWDLPVGK